MSIIYCDKQFAFISHEQFLNNLYNTVFKNGRSVRFKVKKSFFSINEPFKQKEKVLVDQQLDLFTRNIKSQFEEINGIVSKICSKGNSLSACSGREVADDFYKSSKVIENCKGGNNSESNICVEVNSESYLIPRFSNFFNYNVCDISKHLLTRYNFILLDPPWWNKSIRRKRVWDRRQCYDMMWNDDLKKIPIKSLLADDGLVAVWCTNAKSHIESLTNEIFPEWGLTYRTTWTWLKVTTQGKPVVPFAPTNGKQPFERILFASANHQAIEQDKLLISVPSAIHSHKPPLVELLQPYLPEQPKCLEIFARYLLPHWHSYGNDVLKLQDINLFETTEDLI